MSKRENSKMIEILGFIMRFVVKTAVQLGRLNRFNSGQFLQNPLCRSMKPGHIDQSALSSALLPLDDGILTEKEYRACLGSIKQLVDDKISLYHCNIKAMDMFFLENQDKPELKNFMPIRKSDDLQEHIAMLREVFITQLPMAFRADFVQRIRAQQVLQKLSEKEIDEITSGLFSE